MGFRTVVKKFIPKSVFLAIEPYGHLAEAIVFNVLKGFPAKNLKVIGVTGTDGKTTTCMMIAQILRNSGHKVALITTIAVDYADGAGEQLSPTHMTTPSVSQLLDIFKKIRANKPDWVVLETSSHALAQHRVWGIPYSLAVFTNLTHEHLDYHGTFENYRQAKLRLFKLVAKNRRGLRMGIINADDPAATFFEKAVPRSLTYGIKNGELRAKDIKTSPTGSTFKVNSATPKGLQLGIQLNIPASFNVYNALAAIGVGLALEVEPKAIEQGVASLKNVPGRMMRVDEGQPFEVLIDYAVTPAALQSALTAVKEITRGKVMIVFGATGDRDKTKRPVMGEIVAKLADRIFLTDDETYKEDPAKIRQAVLGGIIKANGQAKTTEVQERGEAIAQAIKEAKTGDIILITGLGHQKDRNMGGRLVAWSDAEIARANLKDLLKPISK